jgi:hypothetical protein
MISSLEWQFCSNHDQRRQVKDHCLYEAETADIDTRGDANAIIEVSQFGPEVFAA